MRFLQQRKIACDLSGWVKRRRVVPEDGSEVETPKKRAWTEVPGVRRPSVVIETTPVERLLRELLACNSRVARAAEEKVEVLCEISKEFHGLRAIWSKSLERDGAEEREGEDKTGRERTKTETERENGTEIHTEEGNGVGVVEETEKEEHAEGKGKEKETQAESDVVVVEGRSEDGIGEETLDVE